MPRAAANDRRRTRPHAVALPAHAMTTAQLVFGLLFGSIGLGFFVYGRKQRAVVPFVCGVALMAFPYFVSNTFALVAIGGALSAIPFLVRI